MGSYSADYVCIANPNNGWWIPIVFLQFIIVILGCISHTIFTHFVVLKNRFGTYLRVAFGLISLQMLNILLTSTGAFLITLSHGKYIEDCVISAIELRKYLLYVHSFGEYFFVVCELLGTSERFVSTFYPELRKNRCFKVFFVIGILLGVFFSVAYIYMIRISFKIHLFAIGFGSLTALEFLNGIAVFVLWYIAKKKYQTNKDASLTHKFEFSQSYSYCRCAAASVTARIFIIAYIYLQIAGVLEASSGFYYVMNLVINSYCLVYPWTIMLCHRKTQIELKVTFMRLFCIRSNSIHYETEVKKLYTIDGKQMNTMTAEDHFKQLHNFWS